MRGTCINGTAVAVLEERAKERCEFARRCALHFSGDLGSRDFATTATESSPGRMSLWRNSMMQRGGTLIEEQVQSVRKERNDSRSLSEHVLERRRRINRESMRRRRAERAKSLEAEKQCPTDKRNESSTLVAGSNTETSSKTRRCAICRVRKSVEEVIRLLPSARTRSGFVQVRIPYCGCC